uniref:KIB1-4 beta-propeller domain-containing protein n=1 Tax=Oryza brachyantha TaxID=4533 RepID=J3LJ55_ORYBR
MSSSSRYRNHPEDLAACRSSKRRRGMVADAAATTRGSSSPWASLHEDLLEPIAREVLAGDLVDYVRFRAVCPHWRSSTTCPHGRGIVDRRFHPRRWMLFPEGHGLYPGHGKLGFVRFFNLSTGAFIRVHLPIFKDHCALYSEEGILLLQRDHDAAIRLLNLFTGDILDSPPLETLLRSVSSSLPGEKWYYLRDIRAASINVSADQVVSLMIWSQGMVQIGFATSREQQWRVSSWCFNQIFSPLPFQGKLYVVHNYVTYGQPDILEIDPPQLEGAELWLPPPRLIAKCPASTPQTKFCYILVECDKEILLVTLSCGFHKNINSVYRLADLMLGRTVRVTCIGGNALFIDQRNLCVRSKAFPTVVGDTIVFFHHKQRYLAQYHLNSDTLLPASDGSIREFAILSHFSIIYHIYTCCYREQWNKGQIRFRGDIKGWRVKRKWRHG